MKKIMLLGSGELGKEFTIAAKRAGQYVIACDKYDNAPAMQVADEREVFSMLDGDALTAVVEKHHPDIIVPEIEAIRTERLFDFEKEGIQVVPSARAVNYTMNRRAIRDLAAKELGLRTAKYFYAKTFEEFKNAADEIGFPCVVKPLMSSSGHGQSYVHNDDELMEAYKEAMEEGRGDVKEVIIEEFIDFDSEFTLLTVTQNGYGKRTALTEYLRTGPNGEKQAQSRGGKGLKNYNITPKTGNVAGCRVVGENDDVMLIENGGVIIRIPASSINVYKRDVQGVIVMRIDEGNQVVSLERVEKMDEEESGEQA